MTPGTRNDGLRLRTQFGSDFGFMRAVGTIAGVVVLGVAARNGPGSGRLIASPAGLAWQAPGSGIPGPICPIPSDGEYMLEDGADPSMWVRVQAYSAWLGESGEAAVEIQDSYTLFGFGAVSADVPAANAAAGLTSTVGLRLANITPLPVTNVTVWLSPHAKNLTISSDDVMFVAPIAQNDPDALRYAAIAAGASANIIVRRTIAAGSPFNPSVLNFLRYSWTGI